MRLVPTPGSSELAVHDLGGDPAAPALLLAHATGFHGLVWAPLAAALADRYRCTSFDFPAHGASPVPDGHGLDWERFGDDVLRVVDALGLERPFGVGHSMGGAALLLAEATRPGTFRALWLYEPIVFPGDLADRPEAPPGGHPLAQAARRRRDTFASRDEAYANFASKPPMSVFDPDALRAYVDHGLVDQPDGTVGLACRGEDEAAIYEQGPLHSAWERLPEVRCPVVVAGGRAEDGPPAGWPELLVERLPAGRVERYPDLGHFGPLEAPERLAGSIAAAFSAVGA